MIHPVLVLSLLPAIHHPAMPSPVPGLTYLAKLLKYLSTHKARLAAPPYPDAPPSPAAAGSFWEQTYTIATLGLDPSSAPLNGTLAQVFSLGLAGAAGAPAAAQRQVQGPTTKPLTLRLPPDRILFLLLMFQASTLPALASSPLIRPTDEPLPDGVAVHPSDRTGEEGREGDVASVRSWVGSLRSVGGVFTSGERRNDSGWTSWFGGRRKDTGPDLGTSPHSSRALPLALTPHERNNAPHAIHRFDAPSLAVRRRAEPGRRPDLGPRGTRSVYPCGRDRRARSAGGVSESCEVSFADGDVSSGGGKNVKEGWSWVLERGLEVEALILVLWTSRAQSRQPEPEPTGPNRCAE